MKVLLCLLFIVTLSSAQDIKFKITSLIINENGRVDSVGIQLVQPKDKFNYPSQIFLNSEGAANTGSVINSGIPKFKTSEDGINITCEFTIDVNLCNAYRPFFENNNYVWKLCEIKSSFEKIGKSTSFIPIIISEKHVIGFAIGAYDEDTFVKNFFTKIDTNNHKVTDNLSDPSDNNHQGTDKLSDPSDNNPLEIKPK
jgi:hypothetical protein